MHIIDEEVNEIDPKKIIPKNKLTRLNSARLPNTKLILDVMLEEGFQGGHV